MIDAKTVDELARRLAGAMPAGVTAFRADIENNLRASLESMFQRLDLVAREEYEVQVALLERSRAKLATLEERVKRLEAKQGKQQAKNRREG